MLNLDADTRVDPEVTALVDEYLCTLDRRIAYAWLDPRVRIASD